MAKIIAYQQATPATDDLLLGTQKDQNGTNQTNPTKNFSVGQVVSAGLGYTTYVARLTQLGTSAPTATELKNNTGANMTWVRNSPGEYEIQADANVFDQQDTLVFGNIGETSKHDYFRWRVGNVNFIEVNTYDKDGNPADEVFANGSFEIRIYN